MRRVLKFAEFRSPSHQYARQRRSIRQVLLPLPEIQASLCGACIFCLCVKFLKRGTRVPGNTRDRCRWQVKGAFIGAAVGKIMDKRKPADFYGLPQEGIVCLLPLPRKWLLKQKLLYMQGGILLQMNRAFLVGYWWFTVSTYYKMIRWIATIWRI